VIPGPDGSVLLARGIAKRFGATVALDGFDLTVRRGTLLALLGPSGCGKTTALRVIAGFERPDAGSVAIGERMVAGDGAWVPPERRRVGMVFQDWALFPHLDVWHNVAFGLPRSQHHRVDELIDLVRLVGFERRMPHELSGGQQQRVALARALAPSPEIILLDEPFSNLDAALRAGVRAEVRQVLHEAGASAVFVTHDREEALAIADEVAVMNDGRVLQSGGPAEVYARPADPIVAGLLGDANLLAGTVHHGRAETPLGTVEAPHLPDGPVGILVRPEAIALDPDPEGDARVEDVEFYGHDSLIGVRLADGSVVKVRCFGPQLQLEEGVAVRPRLLDPPLLYA
jgi:iron(III) transport system ATP-binding protein